MVYVHHERLTAAWTLKPADRLGEEMVPGRLVEFDGADCVGRHAAPVVEMGDFTSPHDVPIGAGFGVDRRCRLPSTDGARVLGKGHAPSAAFADVD